jgi:hypothetical protein
MQFLIDHHAEILALLGVAWTLVSGIVALTPSKADDAFLVRLMQRVSFFAPRNVPGVFSLPGKMPRAEDGIGPMLVVLLCFAPVVSGCGGNAPGPCTAYDAVRAACSMLPERCPFGDRE